MNRVGISAAGGPLWWRKRCLRAGSMAKKSTGARAADMVIVSREKNSVVTEVMSTEVVMQTEGTGMVDTEGGTITARMEVGTDTNGIDPDMMRSIAVSMSMISAGATMQGILLTGMQTSTAADREGIVTDADTTFNCHASAIKA